MKKITNDDIDIMLAEIVKEFPLEKLFEANGFPVQQQRQQAPIPQQKKIARPVKKAPIRQVVQPKGIAKKPAISPDPIVKKKPSSQTIPGPNDREPVEKPKAYDPSAVQQKQQMSKTQYQIFNIKMRLGKLGLNDTVRRFVQSMHDFDINVTKNSKDSNDIKSYLAPAQGNLIALKGALESLEAEFNELEKLLNEEN